MFDGARGCVILEFLKANSVISSWEACPNESNPGRGLSGPTVSEGTGGGPISAGLGYETARFKFFNKDHIGAPLDFKTL
jgi:hypothetical protein